MDKCQILSLLGTELVRSKGSFAKSVDATTRFEPDAKDSPVSDYLRRGCECHLGCEAKQILSARHHGADLLVLGPQFELR
jgi:hypothetical protein